MNKVKTVRKAREPKQKIVKEPVVETIKEVVQEVKAVEPVVASSRPDQCKLNDEERMRALKMMMQRLPEQYMKTLEMKQQNLYAILRFEPTIEQLERAQQELDHELKRTA